MANMAVNSQAVSSARPVSATRQASWLPAGVLGTAGGKPCAAAAGAATLDAVASGADFKAYESELAGLAALSVAALPAPLAGEAAVAPDAVVGMAAAAPVVACGALA